MRAKFMHALYTLGNITHEQISINCGTKWENFELTTRYALDLYQTEQQNSDSLNNCTSVCFTKTTASL